MVWPEGARGSLSLDRGTLFAASSLVSASVGVPGCVVVFTDLAPLCSSGGGGGALGGGGVVGGGGGFGFGG